MNATEQLIRDSLMMDDVENYADCGDSEEATAQHIEAEIGRELTEDEYGLVCQMVCDWWILNN